MWTYGSTSHQDVWFADSATTVHVSHNHQDFIIYCKYDENCDIKAFGNNTVKGVGEGDIEAEVKFQGNMTRIRLTQVMHVLSTDSKILSLKVLDQKGFESHLISGKIHIGKNSKIYTKAALGRELYKVKMKIVPPKENVLAAVKRDSSATDLRMWHTLP